MECRTAVTVLLLIWTPIQISSVEINEIQFSALPPLFALDEWSECQEPGDVYCMIDAALVSRQPSAVLTLLQEYSKQTLKHYNRTLVHRGVCVTRCGSKEAGSWTTAAQRCLNMTLIKYGLEADVQSVGYCSVSGEHEHVAAGSSRPLAVLCTLLAALACLATTLHALAERCGKPECNKYLLAFSVKRNWEILTFDRMKPTSNDRMKDIACIEGLRFIGMQCVIFSHVMFIYMYSYTENPHYIEKMYDNLVWKVVLSSRVWVQAFFCLSGFLTAYTVLIISGNSITFYKCLLGIVHRWIRLTPLAVFTLWFTMSWLPRLGSGPQWSWLVGREAADCSETWWYHVVYAHNYLPLGKFCMGHTWYLAADMQLHITAMIVLPMLVRHQRAAAPVLAALAVCSAVAAGMTVYCRDLGPIVTAYTPELIRTMFTGSEVYSLLYSPMWANVPGYAGGMATAFLLHWIQSEGVTKLKKKKVLLHVSLPAGACAGVCAGAAGAAFLSGGAPLGARALYAAVDHSLLALAFSVFMLGCFTGSRSGIHSILNWRGFYVLGRLSYCVFLIHFIIIRITFAGSSHLNHASLLAFVSLFITSSVLSYVTSLPLCLLVELPAIQLWKAMLGDDSRPPAAPANVHPAPPPTHDVKPFDLLANVRRRLEMA